MMNFVPTYKATHDNADTPTISYTYNVHCTHTCTCTCTRTPMYVEATELPALF